MSDLSFVVSGLAADRPPSDPLMPGRLFWAIDTRQMFSDSGNGWNSIVDTDAAPEVSSMRTLGYSHGQASFGDHSHPNALPGPTVSVGDHALMGGLPVVLGNSHGEVFNRDWNETLLKWEYQFVDQNGDTITAAATEFEVIEAPTPRIADMTLAIYPIDGDWSNTTLPRVAVVPGWHPELDAGKAEITINEDDGLGNITTHTVIPWSCAVYISEVSTYVSDHELTFSGFINDVAESLQPLMSSASKPDYWTVSVYSSKTDYEAGGTPLVSLYDVGMEDWDYQTDTDFDFEIEVDARDPDLKPTITSITEYMQADKDDSTIARCYVLFMDWRETPRVPNTLTKLIFQGSGLTQDTDYYGNPEPAEFPEDDIYWKLHSTDPDGNAVVNKLRANRFDDTIEALSDGETLELRHEPRTPNRLLLEFETAGQPDRWTFEIYTSEASKDNGDAALASVSGTSFYSWDEHAEPFYIRMLNTDADIGTDVQAAMDALAADLASASLDYFYEVICYWD